MADFALPFHSSSRRNPRIESGEGSRVARACRLPWTPAFAGVTAEKEAAPPKYDRLAPQAGGAWSVRAGLLAVQMRHLGRLVARAGDRLGRDGALDLSQVLLGQLQLRGGEGFRQARTRAGADQGQDIRTLARDPGAELNRAIR